MVKNKVMESKKNLLHLNEKIKYLEEAIESTKNANEILKLRIQKKELLLLKLELEQIA